MEVWLCPINRTLRGRANLYNCLGEATRRGLLASLDKQGNLVVLNELVDGFGELRGQVATRGTPNHSSAGPAAAAESWHGTHASIGTTGAVRGALSRAAGAKRRAGPGGHGHSDRWRHAGRCRTSQLNGSALKQTAAATGAGARARRPL
eukprot:scaffold1611_cov334-Prasinococcus_capsulatus_cf.AAC.2